jgi:murein DD-endopeptidase MepM/ murein hydrolase activator NlpD
LLSQFQNICKFNKMAQKYIVQKGDTLSGIARKFGVSVADLKTANRLITDALGLGRELLIPTSGNATPPPKPPTPTPPKPPTPNPITQPVIVQPKPVTPFVIPVTPLEKINAVRAQYKVTRTQKADYTQYAFSCPNPSGGVITASFRDNVASKYKLYNNGISYPGQSMPQLPLSMYQSVGLSEAQAKALRFVSMHEGKFDAINSYDKAIFSFGFIQFTGSVATGNSLGMVLSYYKSNCAELFGKYFLAAGIDVVYSFKDGSIAPPVTVSVIHGTTGEKLINDAAYAYIKDHIELFGPFIQSAYEPTMVREQLRAAALMYVQKALNMKLKVTILGIPVEIPIISEILKSEGASTVLIDLCVNRGSGGLAAILAPALVSIAESYNLDSLAALRDIDELSVIQQIIAQNTDSRVVTRTQNIIDSGLSFLKG